VDTLAVRVSARQPVVASTRYEYGRRRRQAHCRSTSSDSVWLPEQTSCTRLPGSAPADARRRAATARAVQLRFTCVARRRRRRQISSAPRAPSLAAASLPLATRNATAASPSHPVTQVVPSRCSSHHRHVLVFNDVPVRSRDRPRNVPSPSTRRVRAHHVAPNSRSFALPVVSTPLFDMPLVPLAPMLPSIGVAASTPLYSRIRTSGYTAPTRTPLSPCSRPPLPPRCSTRSKSSASHPCLSSAHQPAGTCCPPCPSPRSPWRACRFHPIATTFSCPRLRRRVRQRHAGTDADCRHCRV